MERRSIEPVGMILLTLVAAFCSIIYELIFSQALTVIFGDTVTRYSITIGLYLFSLGVGAFLFARLELLRARGAFFAVEVALAILGPVGVIALFLVNSLGVALLLSPGGQVALLVLSHLPIVVVGLLSGLEIPLLASLFAGVGDAFVKVLGWDYVGNLLGTLAYALWLYPHHGLIPAVLAVGFVNALAAVGFFALSWPGRRWGLAVSVVGLGLYVAVLASADRIGEAITVRFEEASILERYWGLGASVTRVEVTDERTTPYQQIVRYRLKGAGGVEECLNLDLHVQACDSWVEAYHHGLVDVPLGFFAADEPVSVLLLGGGDYIPLRFLAAYRNVSGIEQVDLDPDFMAFARQDAFLRRHHRDAFERLERWHVTEMDAFRFLRLNRQRFDLVLMDLPGLMHDKMLPLASVELFRFLARSLKPRGLVVSWRYPEEREPAHDAVLVATQAAAGFGERLTYQSYTTGPQGGAVPSAYFYLLSAGDRRQVDPTGNAYLREFAGQYGRLIWEPLRPAVGVRVNSVFRPNYDLLVAAPRRARPQRWWSTGD